MDGTLVDTEPQWLAAQRQLLVDFDRPVLTPEGEEALVGANLREAAMLFQSLGVPLDVVEIVERVAGHVTELIADGVLWRPGARELLAAGSEAGLRAGLVTNSPHAMAAMVVEQLPPETFGVVVAADDVTRGKPDPQPYLLAAQRLGVAPTDCIVIEDSVHGLRAARAAGMVTIGIPHGASLHGDDADLLLGSLTDLDVDGLRACFAQHRGEAHA